MKLDESSVRDFGIYVRRFIELHGDMPIAHITKRHVREYKDAMLRLPVRASGPLRKMTVPQQLEYMREHPEIQTLSPRTVNDRALGAISAVLGWAEANDSSSRTPPQG
jgi:hypothetical protein